MDSNSKGIDAIRETVLGGNFSVGDYLAVKGIRDDNFKKVCYQISMPPLNNSKEPGLHFDVSEYVYEDNQLYKQKDEKLTIQFNDGKKDDQLSEFFQNEDFTMDTVTLVSDNISNDDKPIELWNKSLFPHVSTRKSADNGYFQDFD
jgi:hypothetical protein